MSYLQRELLPIVMLFLLSSGFSSSLFAEECDNWQENHPEWLFCDDFESGNLSKWEDVSRVSVAGGGENSHDGAYAAQLDYAKGSTGAGWMWRKRLRPDSAARDAQYFRWWQKWESGFEWCSSGCDQKLFMLEGLKPQDGWSQTASWKLYAHLIGDGRASQGVQENEIFLDRLIWDGTDQWNGQWQAFQQNMNVSPYRSGVWECTEIEVVHNTPGQADGRLRIWINDGLAAEYNDVKFRDEAVSWNAIMLTGWYGNSPVPKDQSSWVDGVVVSRERIGCSQLEAPLSPPENLRIEE